MKMEVGNLVEITYDDGSKALGIVTWEKVDIFKSIWSDGNPFKEMNIPLHKYRGITGVWEVINFEEETEMSNKTDELKPSFKSGDIVVVTSVSEKDTVRHQGALGSELTVLKIGKYVKGDRGQWYHLRNSDGKNFYFSEGSLTLKSDIDKKNLSVAQEAANFGYQAVQGIINAHEDKNSLNCRCSEVPPFKKVPFTFSDFDKSVRRTWKDQDFKGAVTNAALGLTGESGEVADLIKKAIYHGRYFKGTHSENCSTKYPFHVDYGTVDPKDVKDELSDVLYYVSAMAQEFGFTLEDIARHNKEKLEKRFPDGFSTEASAQKKDKHSEPQKFPKHMMIRNPTKYYNKHALVYITGETDTHFLSGEVKIPKEVF